MIKYRWILLRMRDVSEKSCGDNQNTHFVFNNSFFLKIMPFWDDVEKIWQSQTDHKWQLMWHICFACWITNATDLHSEYVIFSAFPWRQSLHRCMSVLHFTYIASLVEHLMWPFRRPAFSAFTLTPMVFHFHALLTHAVWNRIGTAVVNNCPRTGK